jgi:hypothetical protein
VLDGVSPSSDLDNVMVQVWSAGDDLRMVSDDCLVMGSVWVRLSPQMFGPLAWCCSGATVLLLWIAGLLPCFVMFGEGHAPCLSCCYPSLDGKHVAGSCVVAVTGRISSCMLVGG